MIKGKTKSGFEFEVDKEAFSDAEFIESFHTMRTSDEMEVFHLVEIVLGKDQKKRLYDHVRNEKGRVPTSALTDELNDIFTALSEANETKN